MNGKLNAAGYHYAQALKEADCIGCQQCVVMCPDTAIEMDQVDEAAERDLSGGRDTPVVRTDRTKPARGSGAGSRRTGRGKPVAASPVTV